MEDLWRGLEAAVRLLASGDREVWGIVLLSLRVSLTATLVSRTGRPLSAETPFAMMAPTVCHFVSAPTPAAVLSPSTSS